MADKAYLSSISLLEQRELLHELLDIWDEEQTILDIMDMTGRAVPTSNVEYHLWTNGLLYSSVTVSGVEAEPAAGADSTITVTGTVPVVGDLCLTPNGERSRVKAVSGQDITLSTPTAGDIAHEAFTGGERLVFFSNAQGEGAASVVMNKPTPTKYSNYIQKFKNMFDITDLALGSKIEWTFKGKDYYMIKGQHDAYRKHRIDIANAMVWGKKGIDTDADGKTVYLTDGLDEQVKAGGIVDPTAASTLARADVKGVIRALDKTGAPDEYFLLAGGDLDNQYDELFGDLNELKAGGISYNAFGKGDGKKKMVDLGMDAFKIYGKTIYKKRFKQFDHPEVGGAAGLTWGNVGFWVPAGQVKTEMGGGMVDRFRTRYFEYPDGTNTRYRERMLGGLAPIPTDSRDVLEVDYSSTEGLEIAGIEHFVKQYLV